MGQNCVSVKYGKAKSECRSCGRNSFMYNADAGRLYTVSSDMTLVSLTCNWLTSVFISETSHSIFAYHAILVTGIGVQFWYN